MKNINLLKTLALALVMVLVTGTANAQIGKLGNMVKEKAGDAVSRAIDKELSVEAIPTTVEEFKTLQTEFGKTPEGCVLLQLVAMEMYRRDKDLGRECLSLNNTNTNLSSVTGRLNELFRENDSYARPYIVAACFKGAKPSNGYNPETPYTIEVRMDPTKSDQRSQLLKGVVKYVQLYSDGWDTHWRNVDVVQQEGEDFYRVSNCPAILTQCKEVDFDSSVEWKGLK